MSVENILFREGEQILGNPMELKVFFVLPIIPPNQLRSQARSANLVKKRKEEAGKGENLYTFELLEIFVKYLLKRTGPHVSHLVPLHRSLDFPRCIQAISFRLCLFSLCLSFFFTFVNLFIFVLCLPVAQRPPALMETEKKGQEISCQDKIR